MVPCDRTGIFRAAITEYGLRDSDRSQAVAITLRVRLLEMWNGQEWDEWEQYDMEATGDLWIVKGDGTYQAAKVEDLVKHAGWDGTFESVLGKTWQPTKCQVSVEAEDNDKGQVRYRIGFINSYDRTPGQVSTVSQDRGRELAARHGPGLKAIAANVKRNGAGPPSGRPASPPAGAAPRPAPPPPARATGDGIPF